MDPRFSRGTPMALQQYLANHVREIMALAPAFPFFSSWPKPLPFADDLAIFPGSHDPNVGGARLL